ncbi:MAG: phosphate ABC transporter permease subunit PstC [Roseiflexaceae bacterium]|nr:phosphate ABC transporter permease subunit PstC [Roseiflexaceae bacterium]
MADQARAGARDAALSAADTSAPINLGARPRIGESVIQALLFICGILTILTTIGIIFVLGRESLTFFQNDAVTLGEFFGTFSWQPVAGQFGIWALISATLVTSVIAIVVSLPLGLGAAIYLSEYATPRARGILKPVLEILAGVPSVVYGYFALQFMTPLLRTFLGWFGIEIPSIYNMLSPGIVIGIMIIPLISSLSEDALSAVPSSLRQAAYGLGSTKFETATKIVVPAALSGILAATIIGISRAVGETMIVALAAGAGPNFTFNPLLAAETMTGHIARISGGDLSYGSIAYQSIFAIGLTLFLLTLVLNIISGYIVRRYREVYE